MEVVVIKQPAHAKLDIALPQASLMNSLKKLIMMANHHHFYNRYNV
jgi:hypothetical protein